MGKEKKEKKRKRDDEREKDKLLKKMLETPEEKRKRRLEKKAKKEAKRKRKQEAMGGYTNETNPFGDSNLTERFVWKLKREKEIEMGLNPEEMDARRERTRREELRMELEKARKRRIEREKEKERWEKEREQLMRERDAACFDDWEKQEHNFHLDQAKMRSEIRIREGRPKPIDILYKNLHSDSDLVELNEPYKIFSDLSLGELEELGQDINMYLDLDRANNEEFWQALRILCDDEISKAKANEAQEGDYQLCPFLSTIGCFYAHLQVV